MNNISQISIFEYREIENQPIAYTEKGEVFYIVDLNNYEKMKYLGYDKENNALRYTRYSTYIEYHWKQIIEYLHQWQEIVKNSRRNIK